MREELLQHIIKDMVASPSGSFDWDASLTKKPRGTRLKITGNLIFKFFSYHTFY